MDNLNEKIFETPLSDVLHGSMMPYAEHVILDRALPRVEDGLKPVQRRILYTMYEMGLTPDKPHRKCAKIVGDCLGKYHPHGDTSVYDALVRMAQPFNMRNILINGHGNFGTVDGDGAAAYRYTEARLEAISYELLRDIDKETVNFNLNFDDSLLEPDTLPGRYPNLLVNGAYGIAVGIATNIPTHNLAEVIDGTVAYIDNPKIKLDALMRYIKGPDFPTGGYIIAGEELENSYRTGKGKIKIRARVNIEKDSSGNQLLVITEIPFQVNKASLLKSIAELKEGKETKESFAGIREIVDESDRNGMRAVVKLRKDADAQKILNLLYKKTQLEISFGINMVAIAGGKPRQMGILDIISYYVNYQREVILRRSKFDLEHAKQRAHILEGLIVAVNNIDKVIKIIRSSENTSVAKQNLMGTFNLSDAQAQAILDLRLARLTKLEINKLENELAELKKLIEELTAIIGDKKLQMQVVKKEMLEIKKKYKEPRRSLIIDDNGGVVESSSDEPIIVEDMVIAVTANDTVKKMTEKSFSNADRSISEKTTKNEVLSCYVRTKSNMAVFAFTNKGKCRYMDMSAMPEKRFREKGNKFNEICKEASRDERVVALFAINFETLKDESVLIVTEQGKLKRTLLTHICDKRNESSYITLDDGDKVKSVLLWQDDKLLMTVTESGKGLKASIDELKLTKTGGGVSGMDFDKNDKLVMAELIESTGYITIMTDSGYYKKVSATDLKPSGRTGKGVKMVELTAGSKVIFSSYNTTSYDIALCDGMGLFFSASTEELPVEGRDTKGKQFKDERKKRLAVSAFAIK